MPPTPHIPAQSAKAFALPGIQFLALAAPSRGACESSVWVVSVEPGTAGAAHQVTREEILVVLDGRARATVAGHDYDIAAGDALIVPPSTDFALANPFDATFRAVAVLPVGGMACVGSEVFTPPWAM